jgi:hypothetical protein
VGIAPFVSDPIEQVHGRQQPTNPLIEVGRVHIKFDGLICQYLLWFLSDPEADEYRDLDHVYDKCKDNCPRERSAHYKQRKACHGNPDTGQG